MESPQALAREEWRAARMALVDQLTRLRDEFRRFELPAVPAASSAGDARRTTVAGAHQAA
jgi:hypothetical protein